MIGLGPRFHTSLVHLLELGYKCRIRLPLFISAGLVLCNIFANFIPRIEINVEVVPEEEDEEEDDEEDNIDTEDDSEYDVDSEGDVAVLEEYREEEV